MTSDNARKPRRRERFVSARGLLKKYPGRLTSAEVNEGKRLEAELEQEKLRRSGRRKGESA